MIEVKESLQDELTFVDTCTFKTVILIISNATMLLLATLRIMELCHKVLHLPNNFTSLWNSEMRTS